MKIAYQGEAGAFSEAALFEHFGSEMESVACPSFRDVFLAVENRDCDFGIIPIENSLAGSIHQNYDHLIESQLNIVGEHFLRVRHCLLAKPGVQLHEIHKVISHPQALAQCEHYLRALKGVTVEPYYDTAGSVKAVSEMESRDVAAIASKRAAEVYGLQIVQEGIEDNQANFTRFLVLSIDPVIDPGEDAKTSIVFTLANQPGSLFKAMSVFALRDIDLTKIESRPLVGKPWEYLFYIDFAGSTTNLTITRALDHLSEYSINLRVLGSYPRHRL